MSEVAQVSVATRVITKPATYANLDVNLSSYLSETLELKVASNEGVAILVSAADVQPLSPCDALKQRAKKSKRATNSNLRGNKQNNSAKVLHR